jgi:hypothetical protein
VLYKKKRPKVSFTQNNNSLQPVAVFVLENEDQRSIVEALALIQGWSSVKPTAIIIDHSMPELNALEEVFPGKLVFIPSYLFCFVHALASALDRFVQDCSFMYHFQCTWLIIQLFI